MKTKLQTISAYTHPAPQSDQQPDTEPGNYYVTCRDGDQTWLMLGPFENDHASAIAAVEPVRTLCTRDNRKSVFYSFGTARFAPDFTRPGNANKYLPELLNPATV